MLSATYDVTLPEVDAQGYDLHLVVKDDTFEAEVTGTYVATQAIRELALDFEGSQVDGALALGVPASFRREGPVLTIDLGRSVPRGAVFTTRVRYHGTIGESDNGLSVHHGLYATLAWPRAARWWIPLRDHPRDGATFAVTATFPSRYVVVANGGWRWYTEGAGTKTWRFDSHEPMPTYDFHLAAYDRWKLSHEGQVNAYVYEDIANRSHDVYGDIPAALDWFARALGPYRWESLSYLEEPLSWGGAMEHATVVSMGEDLFGGPRSAREAAIHELAHHWSGNLVRIRTWNDFWLSEGFANYLTARFLAAHDGKDAERKTWKRMRKSALAADEQETAHALRPPDPEIDVMTIFDATSYDKGACVLRLLERVVGEQAFTAFLRGWFDRHAFQAVTTSDFERELAQETHVDVGPIFDGLVYRPWDPLESTCRHASLSIL